MPRLKGNGWRWQSKNYFFFISLGGDIYRFHISIGPFAVSWEDRSDYEWTRKGKRRARKNGGRKP